MDNNNEITYDELTLSNMWQIEGLFRLMLKKGLITNEEFENEFQELKMEYDKLDNNKK
jgi:hypothetical protein